MVILWRKGSGDYDQAIRPTMPLIAGAHYRRIACDIRAIEKGNIHRPALYPTATGCKVFRLALTVTIGVCGVCWKRHHITLATVP
jgi:hypothetical protein